MRRFNVLALVLPLVLAGAAACSDDEETFTAALSGANEVPAVTTGASGTATFTLMDDGTVSYTVTAQSIENAVASHIHSAPAGENGSIIVDLFVDQPAFSGSGTLVTGTFTADDVKTGNFESLLTGMRGGTVYVNVHTAANPGGEIRGQIQPAN